MANKLRRTEEWKVSADTERNIAAVFEDAALSDNQKFVAVYDLLMQEQVGQMRAPRRWMQKMALRSALTQRSLYALTLGRVARFFAGPHYNPIFNRVAMKVYKNADGTPSFESLVVAAHEGAHAHDRSSRLLFTLLSMKAIVFEFGHIFAPRVATAFARYNMESVAMGAQWEFASRIPRQKRAELIRQLNEFKEIGEDKWDSDLPEDPIFQKEENAKLGMQILSELMPYAIGSYQQSGPKEPKQQSKEMDRALVQRSENKTPEERFEIVKGYFRSLIDLNVDVNKNLSSRHSDFNSVADSAAGFLAEKAISRLFVKKKKQDSLRKQLLNIAVVSLQNADQTKEEFIKALEPVHGYDARNLWRSNASITSWRKLLFGMLLLSLLTSDDTKEAKETLATTKSYDVRAVFYLLNEIDLFDASEN